MLVYVYVYVYVGVDTVVPNYRNQAGVLVSEVLTFNGTLVRQGHGIYLGSSAQQGAPRRRLPPLTDRSAIRQRTG